MTNRTPGNALLWFLLLMGGLFVFSLLVALPFGDVTLPTPTVNVPDGDQDQEPELRAFASCSAITETLAQARAEGMANFRGDVALDAPTAAPQATSESAGIGGSSGAGDYTGTNVQVEGVDEADIVKTDGAYVYALNQPRSVHIVDVRDAENAELISSIEVGGQFASDIFVDGDALAVFTSDALLYPYPGGTQLVSVELYDISDRETPTLMRTVQFEGNLLTSRLIDGEVVVVVQDWPEYYPYVAEGEATDTDGESLIPKFRDNADGELMPAVSCGDVQHIAPIAESNFLTVGRFSISDPNDDVERNVTLGAGSIVYASHDSVYVAGTDYYPVVRLNAVDRLLGSEPPEPQRQRSRIHAFSLGDTIAYRGSTRVFGSALNQFSMDEHDGAFRIATTENQWGGFTGRNASVNALYILDAESLAPLGEITGIAPGETIYSVRFLGERAYVVTFKKVDPFFAIDVSDPRNPRILGRLKIPGYSDYLHPFNEEGTLIIGVGKNAIEAKEGDFAWYQGMKLALFDATDPTNPTQLHTLDIGDRGTDSPALHNHKAFLFDRSRNLLVLPIVLAEISEEQQAAGEEAFGPEFGSFTYQGAFVYELTAEDGFTELGRITHLDDPDEFFLRSGSYYGYSNFFVERAFRIGDALLTLSKGRLKLSDLTDDLSEKAAVDFPGVDDTNIGVAEPEVLR